MTHLDLTALDGKINQLELCLSEASEVVDKSFPVSLKFANEARLVRHFVTCALDDIKWLARQAEAVESAVSRHHDHLVGKTASHASPAALSEEARWSKVTANLLAARTSLVAAQNLLPKKQRTVDGTPFWQRYTTVLEKRFDAAEKEVIDLRKGTRKP